MTRWRPLAAGQAVTHWAMSAPVETLYPGTARPMPDTVDYRFVNGWVATGDLPCREALLAALPSRTVSCPEGPFEDLVFADGGAELDFSRFCHRPTLIERGFRCLMRGDAGPARFRIGTCGGMRLWLDGEPVAMFEPFTRNNPGHAEVTLPLSGAPQTLTLRVEDLHERDTTCFFSIEYLGPGEIEIALPDTFDVEAVSEAASVLEGLRTDRVFYEGDQTLRLVTDHPPLTAISVSITGPAAFGRGGLTMDPGAAPVSHAQMSPDAPAIDLGPAHEHPPGCLSIRLQAHVGSATIERQLGTTILKESTPLSGDWSVRQATALRLIADHGGFEPTVALCLAARGEDPDRMAAIVEAALDTIELRYDCSDFSILPLLQLYRDHGDALPDALRKRMRDAFLGYRYWLDEPGDDVMWFWSENHALCFHAAQRIAGDLFPDGVFTASGRTGREQSAIAAARLTRWFDAIDEDGLCEWNSAAYYPIDMLGLLSLHHMVPDLRDRAANLLDRIFVMAALHTLGGVPAGTQGRCYEKELLAGPHTELGPAMAMALSGYFVPGYDRAAGLLALSGYRPPDGLSTLADVPAGTSLRAAYSQGHRHAGRLTLWKSPQAQLSTIRPHAPGSEGHQAQYLDVQLAHHPLARLWINHPGEDRAWGERRPSLLAGSHVVPALAQYGPYALMNYDLRKDWTALRFTQLFAPHDAFGAPEHVGEWLIFADTVAVWCSQSVTPDTQGYYRRALWRAHGDQMGWCVALRQPLENAQAFVARVSATRPTFIDGVLRLETSDASLTLQNDGTFLLDNEPMPFAPLDTRPHIGWGDDPLRPWEPPQSERT